MVMSSPRRACIIKVLTNRPSVGDMRGPKVLSGLRRLSANEAKDALENATDPYVDAVLTLIAVRQRFGDALACPVSASSPTEVAESAPSS